MKRLTRTDLRNCRPIRWWCTYRPIALALMLLVNGGCTATLWQERGPQARVWIPAGQITEEQLRQEGRTYSKIRMTKQGLREVGIRCDEPIMDVYLAEKTRRQKFNDSVVLTLATPFTLVVDGVIICGILLLACPDLTALIPGCTPPADAR